MKTDNIKAAEVSEALLAELQDTDLTAQYADASSIASADNPLRKRALLLISPSDILVQSSLRHLK